MPELKHADRRVAEAGSSKVSTFQVGLGELVGFGGERWSRLRAMAGPGYPC